MLTKRHTSDRKTRCQQMIQNYSDDVILFSDEKKFVMQQSLNKQNDRIWSCSLQEIPESQRFVQRRQGEKSVMVCGGV